MSAPEDWDALAVVGGAIAAFGAGLAALTSEDGINTRLPVEVQEGLRRVFEALSAMGELLDKANTP